MNKNMINVLLTVDNETVDIEKLKKDQEELNQIGDEFPHDGIVDISQMERLAGLSMRGISICDYWVPVIMVIIGDLNSKRNKAKNEAYINAEEPKSGKLTADLRKCISEADPEYVSLCMIHDRMKAVLRHFEDKRDSFKTFHFFMKDQQKAYGYQGGRHINGENLEFALPKPKIRKEEVGSNQSSSEEEF